MDWYGNQDDEKALQRGFQGEGGVGSDPGDLMLAELAARHGVHHTMIAPLKRQAIAGMAGTFSGAGNAVRTDQLPDAAKVLSALELVCPRIGASVFFAILKPRRNVTLGMQDAPDVDAVLTCHEKHEIGIALQFAAAQSRQIELLSPTGRTACRVSANLRVGGLQRFNEAECRIAPGFGEIMINCLLGIQPCRFARNNGK